MQCQHHHFNILLSPLSSILACRRIRCYHFRRVNTSGINTPMLNPQCPPHTYMHISCKCILKHKLRHKKVAVMHVCVQTHSQCD